MPSMRSLILGIALAAAACGSDDEKKACDPVANTGCDSGKVCEEVTGGQPACFAPVVVRGKVFALDTSAAVKDARVVALDINGAPISAVATSGADGTYELRLPAERAADGTPVAQHLTLRGDAAGYQTFPGGIRVSLPIDTGTSLVVMSSLTDIGLIRLASAGTGAIAGTVAMPSTGGGVLVVAESAAGALTAVADRTGNYRIFNVGAGTWSVQGYAKGVTYGGASATVAAGQVAQANLAIANKPTSKVTGMVNIVDPGGGTTTSVILVVESTFNTMLARGENPPGLRVGGVSNAFTIEGVPEGKYVILAAFENDLLVRDPDTGISGTAIVHQQVTSGTDVTVTADFKVTGALAVIAPGADTPEAVTAKPTLTWKDDSSEDLYQVVVFDALGKPVWNKDNVKRATGSNPMVPYDGPLVKGMYYQFRAESMRDKGNAGLRPISSTEDLRGVFFMP